MSISSSYEISRPVYVKVFTYSSIVLLNKFLLLIRNWPLKVIYVDVFIQNFCVVLWKVHNALCKLSSESHKSTRPSANNEVFSTVSSFISVPFEYMRVYPKVSGLSHNKIYAYNNKTLVEKQHKGLWRQNSLDWLTK
jgi:hypothetical protein